jgi:phospholipid/cholesterol/gamma-HCH transport system substrate-binding protein
MNPAEQRGDPKRRGRALMGIVALCLFGASVWATWIFLTGGFQGGVPVSAVFGPPGIGQQLREGGDVKVRGVLVGRISEIHLDGGAAVLELALNPEVQLSEDTAAEIRSKTVFGEKWIELLPPPGAQSAPFLAAGSEIPDDKTREPLELERALQLGHELLSELPLGDLSDLLHTLAEGFTGSEESARGAIDDGLVALRAVNSRSDALDLSFRQLNEFAAWLDDNATDLVGFAESLDKANRALVGAAPEFRASLVSVPTFLDRFAAFQERTEIDLGRLSETGADIGEVVAARSDRLVDIVRQLQAFTTVWNSGLQQPCNGAFESNLTCWQVYQLPGMDSRGRYSSGGPLSDDPGDPGVQDHSRAQQALDELLSQKVGRRLTRLIVTSALQEFASDLGATP